MKFEDLPKQNFDCRVIYTEKCIECNTEHSIKAQEYDCSEYVTNFYLNCYICGEAVEFEIPVN